MLTKLSQITSNFDLKSMGSEVTAFFEPYWAWPQITPALLASLALLLCFAVLTAVESRYPKNKTPANPLRHSYRTNLSLFAFNSALLSLLSVSSLLLLAETYASNGLLSALQNPVWQTILLFLLFDLSLYLWHLTCHKLDWLWMFHKVHHNDPHLNVSTAFRVHILEVLFATGLKGIYIVLLGADKAAVFISETITTLFVMFHHANIEIPGERLLGKLIVVPYLHRAHHSMERAEHDRNYGAILSIWDRLFGTLTEQQPETIGIKGDTPQTLFGLLKFGFTPDPATAVAPQRPLPMAAPALSMACVNTDAMIAEAAYYKSEKRGFTPGFELIDWLEAEKEIMH